MPRFSVTTIHTVIHDPALLRKTYGKVAEAEGLEPDPSLEAMVVELLTGRTTVPLDSGFEIIAIHSAPSEGV